MKNCFKFIYFLNFKLFPGIKLWFKILYAMFNWCFAIKMWVMFFFMLQILKQLKLAKFSLDSNRTVKKCEKNPLVPLMIGNEPCAKVLMKLVLKCGHICHNSFKLKFVIIFDIIVVYVLILLSKIGFSYIYVD